MVAVGVGADIGVSVDVVDAVQTEVAGGDSGGGVMVASMDEFAGVFEVASGT